MDVSEFFPADKRGSILVTTRNPDCRIYVTVGSCEFGEMDPEEAVTLFLRAAVNIALWVTRIHFV